MAIAFDNKSGAVSGTAVSSLTYSHTVNSNTSGILIVGVQYTDALTVSTVTYAGASLTFLRRDASTGLTTLHTELWYMVAPAAGANNVVITMSGAVAAANVILGASDSLTGVDQVSPIDAQNGTGSSTGGLTASVSVTTVADNAWLVETAGSSGGGVTWTSAETQDTSQNGNFSSTNSQNMAHFGPKTPAGAQTMSETLSLSRQWVISAVSLKPAAATQGLFRPPLLNGISTGGPFFPNPIG